MMATDNDVDIGTRERLLRIKRGMRQQDVSDLTGLRVETISRIETGDHKPQRSTLFALATAFGVSVDKLTGKG